MKVTITQVVPTKAGLSLGLVIEGQKRSWIKFAATALVVEDLDQESREALTAALNRVPAPDSDIYAEQESLF